MNSTAALPNSRVPRALTRDEKIELIALLEERKRRDRARAVAQQQGGWERERAKCCDGLAGLQYWWENYAYTFDPRLIGKPGGAFVQMRLWPKQREVVEWLYRQIIAQEEGLLEKSRDVGATYLTVGTCLWFWLFGDGFKATFGSRKVDLVDKKDDPDCIFHKLRLMLGRQPDELMPAGFKPAVHSTYMQLTNPANGSVITGEGGQDMGRGGRSTIYVLDEAAFVPNATTVEAALSGNTDCVIWVSSVNGPGNLFATKRFRILKPHQIARLHYKDDPRKTAAWAERKRRSMSDDAKWASEYEIDYSASVEGICIPAAWIESCKALAELEPRLFPSNRVRLGGDVGAGKAKSVTIARAGPLVMVPKSRLEPDTTGTAWWMIANAIESGARELNFDAVGVGLGVQSTLMGNPQAGLVINPVNVGVEPSKDEWPDGRTSEEMFGNLKAEIWWKCRVAAQDTHAHVRWLKGDPEGKEADNLTDLLALPSGDYESDTLCFQLSLVKWLRNEKGKIVIESKDALARRGIPSPDYAEALMLTFVEPDDMEAQVMRVQFGAS